ncbi:unnamed protein product, partial [marine sediment metagenome]
EKIDNLLSLGNGNRKITKLDKEIGKIKIENEALKEKLYDLAKIVENMNKLISDKEASITAKLPDIDFTDKDKEFQEKEMRKFRERSDRIQEIKESLKKITQN